MVKFIGQGSFGCVKLCQCRKTKKMVAIKLIKDYADCEYNCIKVAREIQIMKAISMNSKAEQLFIPRLFDMISNTQEVVC
jgi:serine/threonine protein kinase